ncbi:hypothetical protein [Emticicia sp. 17c]|uniref:hypothetical protein n=1 Tax=Emticicia sp. 17c TaxID=3127704 RepID=UPI00301CC168
MKRFFYITNSILVVLMIVDNLFFIPKSSFSEVINYPAHIVYIMVPLSLIVGVYLFSTSRYEKGYKVLLIAYILNIALSILVYLYSSLKKENLKILIENRSNSGIYDINLGRTKRKIAANYIKELKNNSSIAVTCKCRNIRFKKEIDALEYTFIQDGKLKRMIILARGIGTYADSLVIIHYNDKTILKDDNNIVVEEIN